MICVKCNVDSPDGARFCMSCGSALSNASPNCATDLPGGARFCFSCGHAMAEAKRQEARAVIEEIGELFTDERLKSIYLENAGAAVPEPA